MNADHPLPPTKVLKKEVSQPGTSGRKAPRAPKARETAPQASRSAPELELEEDPESEALSLTELAPGKPERRVTERRSRDRQGTPAKESRPGLGGEDVRRIVAERPDLVEAGLRVHTDAEDETVGVGFSTAVGDIDLLARDSAGGWVVVVIAEPGDGGVPGKELVGDLLQLMGWVRKHLGAKGQEVRGIVLLESLPEDLGYAAAAVANTVEFKRYQLALTFESVDVT